MRSLLLFLLAASTGFAAKAQCNANITTSLSGSTITVTNSSTPAAGTGVYAYYTYMWGDGSANDQATTNVSKSHLYKVGGTYTIVLFQNVLDSTVNPPKHCQDSAMRTVTVPGMPCAVSFTKTLTGLNTWQFTATNLNSTPGLTYSWNFGDGTTTTGASVSHTYTTPGWYTVYVKSSNGSCSDSVATTVNIAGPKCRVGINKVPQGNNMWNFSAVNMDSASGMTYTWYFGDGNSTTGATPSHQYLSAGTFTIKLVGSKNGCIDSATTTVTGTNPPNYISGNVIVDSTNTVDSYKVWLITYDSATSILAAVDSQVIAVYGISGFYYFGNKAAGQYRTKAARYNGPTSGTGHVPTYHTSALMWSSATLINHTGSISSGKNITMQTGTLTSGPGFVGGNVNAGANKGTGAGLPGITVFLVDMSGNVVAFTETDQSGAYSFANLPLGGYNLVPENLNYTSTAAMLNITAGNPNVQGVNFERSNKNMTIKPVTSGIANVEKALTFAVFPNPATDVVTINWNKLSDTEAKITITDVSGKTVYSNTAKMNDNAKIDVSSLQAGFYFLGVASEEGHNTQKLVIQ